MNGSKKKFHQQVTCHIKNWWINATRKWQVQTKNTQLTGPDQSGTVKVCEFLKMWAKLLASAKEVRFHFCHLSEPGKSLRLEMESVCNLLMSRMNPGHIFCNIILPSRRIVQIFRSSCENPAEYNHIFMFSSVASICPLFLIILAGGIEKDVALRNLNSDEIHQALLSLLK